MSDAAEKLHAITDAPERYRRVWRYDAQRNNDALARAFEFVERDSRVLDVGCGWGFLGGELSREKGCSVHGLEISPEMAEGARRELAQVDLADVQALNFNEHFHDQRFDYVMFLDVLEHLMNPEEVLHRVSQVLAPGGSLILSVPHVAHASVRLSLLEGRFEYQDEGLLDRTHVRFFTRATVNEMLSKGGFLAIDEQSTYLGARDTEIPIHEGGIISKELIQLLENEPDGTLYQFVMRAVPLQDKTHQGLIETKLRNVERDFSNLRQESIRFDKLLSDLTSPAGHSPTTLQAFPTIQTARQILQSQEDLMRRVESSQRDLLTLRKESAEALRYMAAQIAALTGSQGSAALRSVSAIESRLRAIEERISRYVNFAPLQKLRAFRKKLLRLP